MAEKGAWSLHPQIAQDTAPVGDLPLSRALVMQDANYPWVILVPRRADAVEIIDLAADDEHALWGEIANVSRALKEITTCDKLNIAAIGNVVPQLHVHIVARRRSDPTWPKPVWGAAPPKPYEERALQEMIGALRQRLAVTA